MKTKRARMIMWGVAGAVWALCVQAEPVAVRGGSIRAVDITADAVPWVALEKALLQGQIVPEGNVPPEARSARAPREGHEFVVLSLRLKPGFSVGRMDFNLRIGGGSYECLAMALGDAPFDPRRLEITAESSPEMPRLLYELPKGAEQASLVFALPTALAVPDVQLTLRESNKTAAGEASSQKGGDADAAADEPERARGNE